MERPVFVRWKIASQAFSFHFKASAWFYLSVFFSVLATALLGRGAEEPAAPLPPDVQAVWDLDKAYREFTPTRERICLNGLWQWQPAVAGSERVPLEKWGWFKVPGCWPGITDYMQKDCQTVFTHSSWAAQNLGTLSA